MPIATHEEGTKDFTGIVGDTWATIQTTDPNTTSGVFSFMIDTANLAVGENFEARVLEKVTAAGSQREVCRAVISGPINDPAVVMTPPPLFNGWSFQMRQRTGTARTFPWSIRKVT